MKDFGKRDKPIYGSTNLGVDFMALIAVALYEGDIDLGPRFLIKDMDENGDLDCISVAREPVYCWESLEEAIEKVIHFWENVLGNEESATSIKSYAWVGSRFILSWGNEDADGIEIYWEWNGDE